MLELLVFAASAGLVLAAAAPAAHATVLSSPGIGPPDPLTLGLGSTLLADTGVMPFLTTVYSGTAEEWVYANTANSWGSGDLTFIISVTNAPGSKDALGRITAADFGGFKVDAGSLGFGGEAPDLVTRNSVGDTIGFNYISWLGSRQDDRVPGHRHQREELHDRESLGNQLEDF